MITEQPRAASSTSGRVRSYEVLRMTIGFVAAVLPPLVLSIAYGVDGVVLPSISDAFYHPFAISVFVGSMCAFAAFLWSYQFRGEAWLGNIAAVLATTVAVFPTTPDVPTPGQRTVAVLHYTGAGGFFLCLAIFCVLWVRDADRVARVVYIASVVAIAAGAGLAALGKGTGVDPLFFLGEAVMVEAFAVSWLFRGGVRPSGVVAVFVVAALGVGVYFVAAPLMTPPGPFALVVGVLVVGIICAVLYRDRPHARPAPGSSEG